MARNETPNMVPLVDLSFIFVSPFLKDEAHLECLKGVYSLKLTYIAPARKPSQKEPSLPTIHYEVRTVGFREAITNHSLSTIAPNPQQALTTPVGTRGWHSPPPPSPTTAGYQYECRPFPTSKRQANSMYQGEERQQ